MIADLSTLGGGIVWLGLVVAGPLTRIQEVIALAVLVLVPLGLRLVDTPRRDGKRSIWYTSAVLCQPLAALTTVASLWLARGTLATLLAVPWILVTTMAAGFGAWRLFQRGPWPLAELAIDASLLYLPVASGALVLDRYGVSLFFPLVIITLTVVHFHYAGFVLPLVAGMAGRFAGDGRWRRILRGTIGFVIIGPGVIAIGITFSPLVEVLSVSLFTTAVAIFAIAVLASVVPAAAGRGQQVLLSLGVLALPVSMAVAILYGLGAFTGETYITLDQMVSVHGQLNAFGFALLSLLAVRLAPPSSQARSPGIPFSSLGGGRRVGTDYFERTGFATDRPATGMVETIQAYERADFDPDAIDPAVRRFYEQSGEYDLVVDPDWTGLGRVVARLFRPFARRMDQLLVPWQATDAEQALTGRVTALDLTDSFAGSEGDEARAWIRSNEPVAEKDDRMTYVAAYTRHGQANPLLRVTFPLPIGSLTGLLRFDNGDESGSLVLSSHPAPNNRDDAGLYLVVRGFGLRLPLDEALTVRSGDEDLRVTHEVTMLGMGIVTLEYDVSRASPQPEK